MVSLESVNCDRLRRECTAANALREEKVSSKRMLHLNTNGRGDKGRRIPVSAIETARVPEDTASHNKERFVTLEKKR